MDTNIIQAANPKAQYLAHKKEIDDAIWQVLESGRYILGSQVREFEESFAAFIGTDYCVGVNNGTDAIILALKALDLQPGDEVITVSHSAVATVAAVEAVGAIAVLADIDPISRCIDVNQVEALITPKTRAILPVHLYGQPAAIKEILAIANKHHIYLVEDCAQAHGAEVDGKKVGTFGDIACFSFYPTKNLGAIGDGGAILTSNKELANRVRQLREYGWVERYISEFPGVNSRLDELQAAILQVKLRHLTEDNGRRRRLAAQYQEELQDTGIILPKMMAGTTAVFHLYVVEHEKRDGLKTYLGNQGIGTAIHYPLAIHQQPAYMGRLRGHENLPQTERLVKRILSLPMYPELTNEQIHRVCQSIHGWLNS